MTNLQQQIFAAVDSLAVGEVVSFGDVAAMAGHAKAARAAGKLLATVGDTLPWWRVVYSDGRLPACNPTLQADRLIDEGVALNGFRVMRSPLGRFARKDG